MLWLIFAAPWASLLQCASADCGSSSTTITQIINNTAEARALANECPVFWGDIVIGPDSSGDIILDGLTNLTGSITPPAPIPNFTGTQITTIRSQSLLQIGGSIKIYTAPMLQSVSFPKVQNVVGQIYIGDSPKLTEIDMSSIQECGEWLRIFHTPSLTLLKIPPDATGSPGGIGITNTSLISIDSFTSSPGGVYFGTNPLSRLNLQMTETIMTRSNNLSLDGVGTLTVFDNPSTINISLPYLTSTGGDINLPNCSELSIPALNVVNGSFLMTNASFQSLLAPNLGFINGTVNITGSFTGISGFPALNKIAGDVFIQSSQPLDCAPFQELSRDAKVGGTFFCEGATTTAAAPSSSTTPSPLPSSSASLSAGAKGGIAAGAVVFALLLLSGAFVVFFRRRRARQRQSPTQPAPEAAGRGNWWGWNDKPRAELSVPANEDMSHHQGREIQDPQHGVQELEGQ